MITFGVTKKMCTARFRCEQRVQVPTLRYRAETVDLREKEQSELDVMVL